MAARSCAWELPFSGGAPYIHILLPRDTRDPSNAAAVRISSYLSAHLHQPRLTRKEERKLRARRFPRLARGRKLRARPKPAVNRLVQTCRKSRRRKREYEAPAIRRRPHIAIAKTNYRSKSAHARGGVSATLVLENVRAREHYVSGLCVCDKLIQITAVVRASCGKQSESYPARAIRFAF